SPLFVVAPQTRCGTTFLQRLLNSSREILIYGENNFLIESLPNLLAAVMFNFSGQRAEAMTATRQRVFSGGWDGWYPDLSPEPNNYLVLTMRQIVEHYLYYEEDARGLGRSNWGMKYPLKDAACMPVIAHVLPNARFIVLYRHVADALASARARTFVTDQASAERFVQSWNDNMTWLTTWTGPQILRVRYEDLVADPDAQLPEILKTAGISSIDRETFGVKLNTFAGAGAGRDTSGYVPPAALSDEDRAIIAALAGPGLEAGGYNAA
ncbi:unnamed protein product, partial [Chrysoparadoxa australica]